MSGLWWSKVIEFLSMHRLFLLLAVLWFAVGALLMLLYSTDQLFFAINSLSHPVLDYVMIFFTFLGQGEYIALFLALLLLIYPSLRTKEFLVELFLLIVMLPLLNQGLKFYYNCPRPLTVYGEASVYTVGMLKSAYYKSFPSGHTLGAFSFFTMMSLLLPMSYRKWSVVFFLLPLGCAFSRIYLGQHFFLDVYVGSMIGVCVVCVVHVAMRMIKSKRIKSSVSQK